MLKHNMLGRKKTLTIHTMYAIIVTRKVDLFCTSISTRGDGMQICCNTDHLTGAMVVGVVKL